MAVLVPMVSTGMAAMQVTAVRVVMAHPALMEPASAAMGRPEVSAEMVVLAVLVEPAAYLVRMARLALVATAATGAMVFRPP